MGRRWLSILVGVAMVLAMAGCSGGGASSKSFERGGLSFEYPPAWNDVAVLTVSHPAEQLLSKIVGIDPSNYVQVGVFRSPSPLAVVDFPAKHDALLQELVASIQQSGATLDSGPDDFTLDGLPGFRFRLHGEPAGGRLTTDTVVVFRDSGQYEVSCTWTAGHEGEIKAGCDQVLATFSAG